MKFLCFQMQFVFLLAAMVASIELTPSNWDAQTAGKTVFIKFLAPWWGHCKKMKPAWDKLMKEFADSSTALVADVDCTSDGKPLCDSNGVQGFPTLKWGDPSAMEKYEGGRDYDALKRFAENNLKPMCSPGNIDLCDDDQTVAIEALQGMSMDDLKSEIENGDETIAQAEKDFKDSVSELQANYQKLMSDKDETIANIKDDGLGLKKAVLAHRMKMDKAGKDEL